MESYLIQHFLNHTIVTPLPTESIYNEITLSVSENGDARLTRPEQNDDVPFTDPHHHCKTKTSIKSFIMTMSNKNKLKNYVCSIFAC